MHVYIYRLFYLKHTLGIFTYPQHVMQYLIKIATKSFLPNIGGTQKLDITHSKICSNRFLKIHVLNYNNYVGTDFINRC